MIAVKQPFPTTGLLARNLDLRLPQLRRQLGKPRQPACSYVLRSVQLDRYAMRFEQLGSAPNFQGGRLTLCTCKHQMRASREIDEWCGTWIAGFTGRCIQGGRHWLFYLTQVEAAFGSHAELWDALPARVRNAKMAQDHFLGDLFEPRGVLIGKSRFSPARYAEPKHHTHRMNSCDSGWRNDINYKHADRYGRPALLLGNSRWTFLWRRPMIAYVEEHCRNYLKWDSVLDLLSRLETPKPS